MPEGIIPDEGLNWMLPPWFWHTTIAVLPWQAMLWTNNIDPDSATTLSMLHEASFGGYGRITLYPEKWSVPTILDGCLTIQWDTAAYSWTVTGPPAQNIYGWAIVDPFFNVLRFIQRFDDPDIFGVTSGGVYRLWPTFTMTSAACGSSMLAAKAKSKPKRRR